MSEEWIKIQSENSKKIIKYDTFDINDILYIGGLDISFDKTDNTVGCVYLSVYDNKTKKLIYEDNLMCKMDVPYVSSFLGFREIEHYKLIMNRFFQAYPGSENKIIVMVDGNGIYHKREFGSATHLGYDINISTIGVSKNIMEIFGITRENVSNNLKYKNKLKLTKTNGDTIAYALKTGSATENNPIFVSIGHKISIETAVRIVNEYIKFKVPEPIRNSDIKSRDILRKLSR